jgi:hypothetical protein
MTKYEKIEELVVLVLDCVLFTLKNTKKIRATLKKKVSRPSK